MKKRLVFMLFVVFIFSSSLILAQNALDDVRLFQSFYRDAPITSILYLDGGLEYATSDGGSLTAIGVQGGYPINPKIEVDARFGYLTFSPDKGDGESGLSDLTVAGRYNISPDKTNISVGGLITLPIGEENLGQSKLDFGAFGALRHPLDNGMVITATAGLDFLETTKYTATDEKTEYETSFVLAGGLIYPMNPQLNIVGELVLKTEVDWTMLSGGVDYKLQSGSRVRGALGIGLNEDGTPDFQIFATFLHPF